MIYNNNRGPYIRPDIGSTYLNYYSNQNSNNPYAQTNYASPKKTVESNKTVEAKTEEAKTEEAKAPEGSRDTAQVVVATCTSCFGHLF